MIGLLFSSKIARIAVAWSILFPAFMAMISLAFSLLSYISFPSQIVGIWNYFDCTTNLQIVLSSIGVSIVCRFSFLISNWIAGGVL